MKIVTVIVFFLALMSFGLLHASAASIPTTSDEFVGPFASWTNVKTAYGAVGDGVTDDTAAIQSALNALASGTGSPILYFPDGTYKITGTLTLAHAIDVSLVGQDPALTNIVWDGAASGTLLYMNGVAYSKITRLTFNGENSALIDVDQSKADAPSNYFDTGNEYSDDVFENAGYGIRGGAYGYGFAETSVERDHFLDDSIAGIAMLNFNALDLWVWYSTFQNCYMGVTNSVPGVGGAGNFHVYGSYFASSTVADLYMGNAGGFSARDNYSIDSGAFFSNAGASNNPATIDIVGNTVLDPTNSSGNAVSLGSQGPYLIMDNTFRTQATSTGVVGTFTFSDDQDVESIDTTFTATSGEVLYGGGKLIQIGDQVVPFASVNPTAPVLPGTLPNFNRQDFEVATGTGNDASAIQSAINAAYAQNGNRPVVHIPYGTYHITQTIVVPPSDIQIVGDGYGVGDGGTVLNWTGSGTSPVLQIDGPSDVTLRDLGVAGTVGDGILMDDIDQSGSRVYMDQPQLGEYTSTQSALLVNGLTNSTVEMENVGINALADVTGGANVDIFSGSGGSANSSSTFETTGGGKLLVQDWWDDAGSGQASTAFASVNGSAEFTADGDEMYQSGNGTPDVAIANLNGTATVLTSNLTSNMSISGDGSNASVLGMGLVNANTTSTYFLNTMSPAGTAALVNSREATTTSGDATAQVQDIGSAGSSFITAMLAQVQNQNPAVLSALSAGVSDVRLFRIAATSLNDVTLQGDLDPLSVSLLSPAASSTVSSTITLSASTTDTDDVPVSGVQFQIDGTNLGSLVTATSGPGIYSKTWNTTSSINTSHTITAIAYDALNNSSTASVTVTMANSTPSAPRNLAATPGNAQISLSWLVPTSSGGSGITQYLIYDRFTGSSTFALYATTTVSQTTSTVTSLANGQSYDFEIAAQNTFGISTPSGVMSSTPYTVPNAPTTVSPVAGDGEATVSFTPAFNGGSNVLYYTVSSSPGDVSVSSTATSIVVGGLANGTSYTFIVTATNAAGTSAVSVVSSGVTPEAVPSSGGGSSGGGSSGGSGGGGGGYGNFSAPPMVPASIPSSTTLSSSAAIEALIAELRPLTIELLASTNQGRPLTIGSDGPDVFALQVFLSIDGAGSASVRLASIGPTGYFGPVTQRALAEYQASVGIAPAVGYFGPKTRAYLESNY